MSSISYDLSIFHSWVDWDFRIWLALHQSRTCSKSSPVPSLDILHSMLGYSAISEPKKKDKNIGGIQARLILSCQLFRFNLKELE